MISFTKDEIKQILIKFIQNNSNLNEYDNASVEYDGDEMTGKISIRLERFSDNEKQEMVFTD